MSYPRRTVADMNTSTNDSPRQQVIRRYLKLNGTHPMSYVDDAYVNQYYVTLDDLCASRLDEPDRIRSHMLLGELPLPSYLRSDGAEMVHRDYLALADQAGGVRALPTWFQRHWTDRELAAAEWENYLSGQYVCLHSVNPSTITRKDEIVTALNACLQDPHPRSDRWLTSLHTLVDELDRLEPPFTAYDRLRFGCPTSREIYIDAIRRQYPLNSGSPAEHRSPDSLRPKPSRDPCSAA